MKAQSLALPCLQIKVKAERQNKEFTTRVIVYDGHTGERRNIDSDGNYGAYEKDNVITTQWYPELGVLYRRIGWVRKDGLELLPDPNALCNLDRADYAWLTFKEGAVAP